MLRKPSGFYVCMVLVTLMLACGTTLFGPQASTTPGVSPIDLAGPEMKVGSTYQYVDGTLLVAVPAGPFTMGGDGPDNPVHTVTLSDFWIYSTKVTNQQFAQCVKAGACTAPDAAVSPGYKSLGLGAKPEKTSPDMKDNPGFDQPASADEPIVGVTYDQASAYCDFVHARLPTEAEWEKTARGPDGKVYPWGDAAPSCDLLNFNKCVGITTNVIAYPQGQSYYHALDMEGNAFEWTGNWYDPAYYKTGPAQDPSGPDTGQERSVRSSSYKSTSDQVPASQRFHDLPTSHRSDLGFRCVVTDLAYFAPFCQTVVVTGPGGPTTGAGSCPKPYLKSEPVCLPGDVPGEIVTFGPKSSTPGGGVSFDPGSGCSFVSVDTSYKWVCKAPGAPAAGFTLIQVCSVSGTEGCVPGYAYDAATKSCLPKAISTTAGKCLPGLTYDPAKQCCSAVPGSTGPYAPCPPGFPYWKDTNKCTRVVTLTVPLTPGSCKPKPPGDGPPPPPCDPNTPGYPAC
jgi:formylglycine-generating enzyme required for sulfatase activity